MADTKKVQIITIEAPTNGLISEFSPTANPAEGGEAQYRYTFGATVVRPGYKGHIAPVEIFDANKVNDVGSGINTLPRSVAAHIPFDAGNGNATVTAGLGGTAPRVVLFDNTYAETSFHTITTSNNFTTLPATGFWGEDVIFYTSFLGTVGTYVDAVFYTYNDSAKGSIGFLTFHGGLSWNDDFTNSGGPGVTLAAGSADHLLPGVPHRMCVGPDKILYITNGQYIASFDGTADQGGAYGTFNSFALDLGPGWIATDVQPYQNFIAISITQMGASYQAPAACKDARVILWNGSDLDFDQVYPLND